MTSVVWHGSRQELVSRAYALAAALAGAGPDPGGYIRTWHVAIGVAVLADIRDAFIVKSRRGTDAMGIQWPELSPKTIANRRIGPGDLDDPAIKSFVNTRKAIEKQLYARFQVSMNDADAKARAKQVAPGMAYRALGTTKVQLLGHRLVEILRDTGRLFNSLMPSEAGFGGIIGQDENEFEIQNGTISVGTNVVYAGTHQYGRPERNIPARPFFPPDAEMIPESWWDNWIDAGEHALQAAVVAFFSA